AGPDRAARRGRPRRTMSDPLSPAAPADAARSDGDFRPPHLLRNGHVQTVLGQLLPGPPFAHPTRRHVVRLPDGDGLVLQDTAPAGWRPGGRCPAWTGLPTSAPHRPGALQRPAGA